MPTNRKRKVPPLRQTEGLTPKRESYLVLGTWFFGDKDEQFPFHSMDHAREIWEQYKDDLMAGRFQFRWFGQTENREPGKRPWAWWEFHGVPKYGPRKLIRGEDRKVGLWYSFGLPAFVTEFDDGDQYETQAEYLERNGLLTPEEQAELRKTPPPDKERTAGGGAVPWAKGMTEQEAIEIIKSWSK